MTTSHLYKITDTERNKFYIGKHHGTEQGNYWGSGKRIKRHVKKYGTTTLVYEILLIGDEQYIYDIEAAYVDNAFLANNPNCINIYGGGKGGNKGQKTSIEARLKQSAAKIGKTSPRKGVALSQETKQKIGAANKGKKRDKSVGEKLRVLHTGRVLRKTQCPHCLLEGGVPAMKRWHFNNCKNKDQTL